MACWFWVMTSSASIAVDWTTLVQLAAVIAAAALLWKALVFAVNSHRDIRRIPLMVAYLRKMHAYHRRRLMPGERLPCLHLDPDVEPESEDEETGTSYSDQAGLEVHRQGGK